MLEAAETRSRIMRAVKGRDTGPEMTVRRLLYGLGYRYRLHWSDLPGKPDIVLLGRRKVVFVHGCFWHGHSCPRGARAPKTNGAYWSAKIARNVVRDRDSIETLQALGWSALTIWECKLKDQDRLRCDLQRFLEP